jgi:ketosteroid isomerase-like protein
MTPDIIIRYFKAADDKDFDTLIACFTEDATVFDEDKTYGGHAEIRQWRSTTASQWEYTVTVTGSSPDGDGYLVRVHLVGNFPGGEADLRYRFTLRDGLISALSIVP